MTQQCFWYVHEYMSLKQFTIKLINVYTSAFPLHSSDENAYIRRFKYKLGQSNLNKLCGRISNGFRGMSPVV
jgi:hypothetical protein